MNDEKNSALYAKSKALADASLTALRKKLDRIQKNIQRKQQQGGFPCSIHTILANLGYLPASDSTVGDLWNWLHGDLNNSAPNEEQIHSYLAQTFELGKKDVVYAHGLQNQM